MDRKQGKLTVLGLWWETGVKSTKARKTRLESELRKLAGFTGAGEVIFARGDAKA